MLAGAEIAVIGQGVMGGNLSLNLADRGARVVAYDVDAGKSADPAHDRIVRAADLGRAVGALSPPRMVLLMIPAGAAVDRQIDALIPLLAPGDVVIDGGNSHYADGDRREERLAGAGIGFLGLGVSGGSDGARHGPALMAGGSEPAYRLAEPLLTAIAATSDDGPCCAYFGAGGRGHYVKMVHNGIEYALMQLIAEAAFLLHERAGLAWGAVGDRFRAWNGGMLGAYLMELAADVLAAADAETGRPMLDIIADRAAQKGTGAWTVQAAIEMGVAVPTIAEAVFARSQSGDTAARESVAAAGLASAPAAETFPAEDLEHGLVAGFIAAFAQGFDLLAASGRQDRPIDPVAVCRVWRGGCIVRAALLAPIARAYTRTPNLANLMADPDIASTLGVALPALRRIVAVAAGSGIPAPGLGSALGYIEAFRRDRLPMTMIQGLRDHFGAHEFERIDRPGRFHRDWRGT